VKTAKLFHLEQFAIYGTAHACVLLFKWLSFVTELLFYFSVDTTNIKLHVMCSCVCACTRACVRVWVGVGVGVGGFCSM